MLISKAEPPTSAHVLAYIQKRCDDGKNFRILYDQWNSLKKGMEALYGNSLEDVRGEIQQVIANAKLLHSGVETTAFGKRGISRRPKPY